MGLVPVLRTGIRARFIVPGRKNSRHALTRSPSILFVYLETNVVHSTGAET